MSGVGSTIHPSTLERSSLEKNYEAHKQGLHSLKLATDLGVIIVFGSDLLGPLHFAQADEFALRAQVQTPLQILQFATVTQSCFIVRRPRVKSPWVRR